MPSSVSDTKQTFFKAVSSEKDREDVLESLAASQALLQLKEEGKKTAGPQDLTVVKASGRLESAIVAGFVSGPALSLCDVTVAFELAKAMFFCTARLSEVQSNKYVLRFQKIFELQRRDAYRVIIPANLISAKVRVLSVNKKPINQEFRIEDLSAGGMGLAANEASAATIPAGSELLVTISVGTHAAVEAKATVKYLRKVTSEKNPYVHVGCEFLGLTAALGQKLAFLVNDCHRVTFARLGK